MSGPDEQPPLRVRLGEGAVLLAVALLCLGFQLRLPGKLVDERDYQAVAGVLQQEAQPGDAVLLYPWWTERARLYLPASVRVVGYLGSDADPLELAPRIWVLAEPELPRSDLGAFMAAFGPQRTELGAERRFGNLSLRLFSNGRRRPLTFSATDSLAQAQVYLEGPDGSRQPCAWTGRSHRCPNGGEVLPEWHEVRFQPRRCLRFWPPGGAQRLVAEFQAVPASDALVLYAGYTWDRGWFREGVASSELGLEVNGAFTPLPLPAGLEGLQKLETGQVPAGTRARVWVSSQNPNARELCFELYGFGGAP